MDLNVLGWWLMGIYLSESTFEMNVQVIPTRLDQGFYRNAVRKELIGGP